VEAAAGLQVLDAGGRVLEKNWRGFDHFDG
jgi:hypothetical protein